MAIINSLFKNCVMQKLANKAFNLEKFQAEFKAKQFGEFHYYTTLVKALAQVDDKASLSHLSTARAEQLDAIAFERFINLTGEKANFDCTLLIDTETGYLYSPKWFNTNNRTFATINDYEIFVSQQVIAGVNDWELVEPSHFEKIDMDERIDWFNSKIKNQVIVSPYFYSHYGHINITRFFYLNKSLSIDFYANTSNGSKEFFYFGEYYESEIASTYKAFYPCDKLHTIYPNWKKEKILTQGEAYPFIYSRRFADLDIWGNKFSAFSFIKFLVENDFDTSFLPKAPNLIPYILDALQKNTGIQLHQDTITFPCHFFNPQSELSKHQNVIDYTDFLLWKIESYSKTHAEQLSKANSLYSQLADLKTHNQNLQPIQQYLLQKFDFSLQNLESKLLQFKSQSIQYLEKMDNLNAISDFIQPPFSLDFNLYGETVTRLYNNQIKKVANFSKEIDFLQQLFEKIVALFQAAQNFITSQKEQLRLDCQKNYVEDSFERLISEWQTEIEEIENSYLPVIQAYFIGTMNQTATLQTLTLLQEYRNAVDNFFLTERIALIQKYHDNPKTEFLQRIDKESKLFKSRCAIVNGLKNLIAHEPQHLAKKSLNTLSESLLTRQIDTLLSFSQDANLALQLQTEFMELQQRNFETYLADVEQYGKELDKRDKEIQGLIFKMKKDLERQNNTKNITGENE